MINFDRLIDIGQRLRFDTLRCITEREPSQAANERETS